MANAVLEVDHVLLAGAAAVLVGGAFTQEDAEHAMLHMKHGHVLVKGELEPVAWCRVRKLQNLTDVEVVGDGELIETGLFLEQFGSDGVGDVE